MLFYFESVNKNAVWKENWVEFCSMTAKFGGLFSENNIAGK